MTPSSRIASGVGALGHGGRAAGLILAFGISAMLAACDRSDAPAPNATAANVAAPARPGPEGAVTIAQNLVREQLGNPQGLAFANPRRSAAEGVQIICGEYRQSGRSQRYIVVDGRDVFLEPRMEPGEMDRAFGEFCNESPAPRSTL